MPLYQDGLKGLSDFFTFESPGRRPGFFIGRLTG
jgi:hypothetical protein